MSPWMKHTETAPTPEKSELAPTEAHSIEYTHTYGQTPKPLTEAQQAVKAAPDDGVMYNVEQYRERNRNQTTGNVNMRGDGWKQGEMGSHGLGDGANPDPCPIFTRVASRPLYSYHASKAKDAADCSLSEASDIGVLQGVPDFKAMVREDNGAVLGVVGNDYQIVQTQDIVTAHENAIERAFPADMLRNVTTKDSISRGGAFTKREYVFPECVAKISESPRGKYSSSTDVMLRSSIYTTHDGHGSAASAFSSIDGFCANSLLYSHMDVFRRRHTSGFIMPEKAFAAHAEAALENWNERVALMNMWSQYQLTSKDAKDKLESIKTISERRREKLLVRFDVEAGRRGATMWALVSAMTFYASHNDTDSGFGVRGSGGKDNESETLNKREAEVVVWINNPAIKSLSR